MRFLKRHPRLAGASGLLVLLLAFPFMSSASSTTTVKLSSPSGWTITDFAAGANLAFVSDGTGPASAGALQLTTNATTAAKVQYMHSASIALSSVSELSYYTKRNSGPSFGAASFQLPVYLEGNASKFTTLVYEPYWNNPGPAAGIVPAGWTSWDVDAGRFWSSSSRTCASGSLGAGAGGPPFYSLATVEAFCPGTVVLGFGVKVGSFNPSYDVEVDLVSMNGDAYDFEPETPCTTDCYVDNTSGNDAFGGDTPGTAKKTIQAAVNQVNTNGTVHVAAGAYAENVLVARSMVIKGAHFGDSVSGRTYGSASESTIVAPAVVGGTSAVRITASDVTLDGFSVRSNSATNGSAFGVSITGSGDNALISHNIFDGISTTDTTSQGTAQAVYLVSGPDGVTINHNSMTNITSNRSAKGVLIGDSTATNPSQNIVIDDNSISSVTSATRGGYAIQVNNGNGSTSNSGLQITNNTVSAIAGTSGWAHAIGLEANTPGVLVTKNVVSGVSSPGTDTIAVWFEANPGFGSADVNRNSLDVGGSAFGIVVHPALSGGSVDGQCNWWGHASGPSGVAAGTGSLVGPSIDYSDWLMSSDLNGACIGGTPSGDKQLVLATLQSLLPTGDAKADKRIVKAIERLQKSLTPAWWDGPLALDPKSGGKVFDEEKKVVEELSKNELEGNPVAAQLILTIVAVDRSLAQYAIDNAVGVKPSDMAKAIDEMAKGDAYAAVGKYENAIEHYKHAWERVTK